MYVHQEGVQGKRLSLTVNPVCSSQCGWDYVQSDVQIHDACRRAVVAGSQVKCSIETEFDDNLFVAICDALTTFPVRRPLVMICTTPSVILAYDNYYSCVHSVALCMQLLGGGEADS